MMLDPLAFYLHKIKKLRINRNHGKPAPHKPLLLLAVIDLIEQSAIQANEIQPAPQLVESFLKYWNLLGLERPRIFLPFYHLQSDGFWHLHAKNGQTSYPFKSMSQLASVIAFASLDDDLFLLLHNAQAREAIRNTIIETYFPDKAILIRHAVNENQQINALENLLIENAEQKIDTKQIPATPQRSAAFRGVIMKLYDYTCAACRLRILTLDGLTAVDAAHIIPFSVSRDDSIGNGLALCKLHHWAFDNGLISIDDKFRLLVSTLFEESGNEAFLLRCLQAQPILLPKQKPFFPSLATILWHRTSKFQN
ncbi:MAG: HNH endonuclease [Pyrinomonadaceae bacterium]